MADSTGKSSTPLRVNFVAFLFFVIPLAIGIWLTFRTDSFVPAIVGAVIAVVISPSPKIASQWERAIVLRLGRYIGMRGPGLFWIVPFIDTIAAGQETPLLGWQSTRYGELRPAPMLRLGVRNNDGPYAMLIASGGASLSPSLVEAVALPREAYGFRVTTGRYVDYVLMSAGADQEMVCWNLHFAGKLLWLRTSDGAPRVVRWVRGRSVRMEGMTVRTEESVDELIVHVLPAGPVVRGCPAECISIEGVGGNGAESAT